MFEAFLQWQNISVVSQLRWDDILKKFLLGFAMQKPVIVQSTIVGESLCGFQPQKIYAVVQHVVNDFYSFHPGEL
jgi:hypothetical protein